MGAVENYYEDTSHIVPAPDVFVKLGDIFTLLATTKATALALDLSIHSCFVAVEAGLQAIHHFSAVCPPVERFQAAFPYNTHAATFVSQTFQQPGAARRRRRRRRRASTPNCDSDPLTEWYHLPQADGDSSSGSGEECFTGLQLSRPVDKSPTFTTRHPDLETAMPTDDRDGNQEVVMTSASHAATTFHTTGCAQAELEDTCRCAFASPNEFQALIDAISDDEEPHGESLAPPCDVSWSPCNRRGFLSVLDISRLAPVCRHTRHFGLRDSERPIAMQIASRRASSVTRSLESQSDHLNVTSTAAIAHIDSLFVPESGTPNELGKSCGAPLQPSDEHISQVSPLAASVTGPLDLDHDPVASALAPCTSEAMRPTVVPSGKGLGSSRTRLIRQTFDLLDSNQDGFLDTNELWPFAHFGGFRGTLSEWSLEYAQLCDRFDSCPAGLDLANFIILLNDTSTEGCFCLDRELHVLGRILTLPVSASRDILASTVQQFQRSSPDNHIFWQQHIQSEGNTILDSRRYPRHTLKFFLDLLVGRI